MRQLSKEECGVISGGISTTNKPTVFVNAAPPPNGVYIPSSGTGPTRGQANEACDLVGGVAKLAKKNPVTKGISPTAACKNGVKATINAEDAMPKAICTQVDEGSWDAARRVCVQ